MFPYFETKQASISFFLWRFFRPAIKAAGPPGYIAEKEKSKSSLHFSFLMLEVALPTQKSMSDVTPPPKKRPREQQNGQQDTQKRNAHIAQCQVGGKISVSPSLFPYFSFFGGHEKEEEEEKWGTDGR